MSGYAAIAKRMAHGSDLSAVRSFSELNYRNILFLQAELTDLEEKWLEKESKMSTDQDSEKRENIPFNWQRMRKESAWADFVTLRAKLNEYNEALIQQHMISHFDRPSQRSLKIIQNFMDDTTKNEYLLGADSKTWSDEACIKDLVTLGNVVQIDRISHMIIKLWLGLKEKMPRRAKVQSDSIVHIEESSLLLPTTMLSIVLSSLLPVAGIAVLYAVHTMWRRLLILAAFTSAFSLTLALITSNAKRLEVFAATATFSAVLVVFIGTNTGN